MNDDKCYMFFEGYHSVASASDKLTRFRIDNRIVKAPVYMRGSCSFAVMVDKQNIQMSRMVLNDNMIDIKCSEK